MALDTVARRDIVRLIERDARLSIEQVQPTMLLMPWTSYNRRRGPATPLRHLVQYVLCYDNTSLFWSPPAERFHPNVFVDVSGFRAVKMEALYEQPIPNLAAADLLFWRGRSGIRSLIPR